MGKTRLAHSRKPLCIHSQRGLGHHLTINSNALSELQKRLCIPNNNALRSSADSGFRVVISITLPDRNASPWLVIGRGFNTGIVAHKLYCEHQLAKCSTMSGDLALTRHADFRSSLESRSVFQSGSRFIRPSLNTAATYLDMVKLFFQILYVLGSAHMVSCECSACCSVKKVESSSRR